MEFINVNDVNETRFETAIALGNFDGIHMGHQGLIKAMILKSKELGLKPSVLLFQNHTKMTLEGKGPQLLTTLEQKYSVLEDLGVEIIYTMEFNEQIMKLTPEEFVRDILVNKINIKAVIIGTDYRFGHKASGDANLLKELGNKYAFQVTILDPVYIDGNKVSSTLIRELLSKGDLEAVKLLLGREYTLTGKVVGGKKIGKTMGYPTANIELVYNSVIPKNGVYSTKTIVDGKTYLSATSVGFNPTFKEDSLKIETHILDFNGDLYGKVIRLVFVKYLRDELKFENIEELKKQIDKDIFQVKGH